MRILLFSWLFLVPFIQIFFGFDIVFASSQCLNDQRSLLLNFRDSLNSSISTKLMQWNHSGDCCQWMGVKCDSAGHVISLELDSESISGSINNSSSLFNLQFLQSLNLAYNSFNASQIPSRFKNLTSLTYLNLSNAGFSGQIPIEFSSMARLVTLDLSTLFSIYPPLKVENPNLFMLVRNLPELLELHLDGVNISAPGHDWCQAISSSLPKLQVLSLNNCHLSGPIDPSLSNLSSLSVIRLGQNNLSTTVPELFANFSSLTALGLSSCNLQGAFPEKIFQVPTLRTLELSNNGLLHGSLPEFPQNGSLQTLVLSYTNFSGALPNSIGNLGMLSRIDLANCTFTGSIPNSLASLTHLLYLDFSFNNFSGPVPSFRMSKNLTYIDLSRNKLTGLVSPTTFEGLSDLVFINLGYNLFNGSIPQSLFVLPSLRQLQLSNNQFNGQVDEFLRSQLDTLDLSGNNLEGHIPTSFFGLKRLSVLLLSSNKFNGTIQLEMIQSLPNLTRLELSYNNLSIITSSSNSSLSPFPQLSILKLASCKLQKFPELQNQSRMIHLDLSDNQIYGEIPNWIWKVGNESLIHLNLSRNLLVALQEPYLIPSVSVLDLHSNRLNGKIPIPPPSAAYVDYSSNNFSSPIPPDIGNNISLAIFFSLSNNSIRGIIPISICNASYLQVLDLSNNGLNGTIPSCLIERNTETLGVLNLRNNRFSGTILGTFSGSCHLKTLDLNGNLLEGQVPKSLANCSMLEVLNIGNNKINDTFPLWLKNSSNLRVLVLRSNMFHGSISCREGNHSWPNLQIIDIASNHFSGDLSPECFLNWKAMMGDEDDAQSELNHLHFEFLKLSRLYYQDTVTVTNKGLEMELVKILTIFTSIDFSNNSFEGDIPEVVGDLKSLYVLNLSHNVLTGTIPPSIGNLKQLGSLDLSVNKLSGMIPTTLLKLTFLSFLNLSYNQLFGTIPTGSQFQTFSADSYEGIRGLCGFPLNTTCNNTAVAPSPSHGSSSNVLTPSTKFDWQFIFTGLGFGVGAGIVVGPLMFWKQGRHWCDEHIDYLLLTILPIFGFIYTRCDDVKVEAEENIDEESTDDAEDEDEDEMEDKAFRGQYCVFCTKLDIFRKKTIHDPKCTCHDSLPISSSFSLSSSS